MFITDFYSLPFLGISFLSKLMMIFNCYQKLYILVSMFLRPAPCRYACIICEMAAKKPFTKQRGFINVVNSF